MRKFTISIGILCLLFSVTIGLALMTRRLLIPQPIPVRDVRLSALTPVNFRARLSVYEALIGSSYEIFIRDDRTGQAQQLTHHFSNDRFPVLSPAGDQVAFVSWRNGNSEIYVIDLATGAWRNVSSHSGRDILPVWSPDGNLLAYASNHNTQFDIFVADIDRGLTQNLTRSPYHESQPLWLTSGQALAVISDRGGVRGSLIVDLSGQEVKGIAPRMQWQTADNSDNMSAIGGEVSG